MHCDLSKSRLFDDEARKRVECWNTEEHEDDKDLFSFFEREYCDMWLDLDENPTTENVSLPMKVPSEGWRHTVVPPGHTWVYPHPYIYRYSDLSVPIPEYKETYKYMLCLT